MIQSLFTITENVCLAKNIWRMRLQGDTSAITAPGQFVNVKLDGLFLRRPISVCDCQGDVLTLIYKVAGKGTEVMKGMTGGSLEIESKVGVGTRVRAYFKTDHLDFTPIGDMTSTVISLVS